MTGGRFVSAVELSRDLYENVVRPWVSAWPHAAARIGTGSDVLGFDDERSTDHGWGPAVVVFVDDDVVGSARAALSQVGGGEVEVTTLSEWLRRRLGFDPSAGTVEWIDWLLTPQQALLEVTAGAVFADDAGVLAAVRHRLARFPDDVWLWLLACQWRRLSQEEPFVGRAAEVGDDLGSRILASRVARELMRLWFLFERTYWPYPKWFGAAFARLPGSETLADALAAAHAAADYRAREAALVDAYELVAARHNELGVTDELDTTARLFHDRPYRVIAADRFVDACLHSPALASSPNLTRLPLVGSVDQVADSTDVLSHGDRPRLLRALYEAATG